MPRNSADQSRPPPDHQKELLKLFGSLAYRHSAWQVFVDFAEAAAISLSNAVDWAQRDPREERYMAIVKRYKPEELATFPKMLGELTLALEEEPSDVLGRTFHDLELHNKWSGQFFSPYPLCRMMAKMTVAVGKGAKVAVKIGPAESYAMAILGQFALEFQAADIRQPAAMRRDMDGCTFTRNGFPTLSPFRRGRTCL